MDGDQLIYTYFTKQVHLTCAAYIIVIGSFVEATCTFLRGATPMIMMNTKTMMDDENDDDDDDDLGIVR